MGSVLVGESSTFSEHGHVAYQILENHECSKMVACMPADTSLSDPGDGASIRLDGKFHPRYLLVAFTGISQHGKYGLSGKYNFFAAKYWQI